ncbi:MAG: hypothetical protein JKY65_19095 [Planctomycetes bacterium]|nr:hypothetical protein [Planctomycetota bacterium]
MWGEAFEVAQAFARHEGRRELGLGLLSAREHVRLGDAGGSCVVARDLLREGLVAADRPDTAQALDQQRLIAAAPGTGL